MTVSEEFAAIASEAEDLRKQVASRLRLAVATSQTYTEHNSTPEELEGALEDLERDVITVIKMLDP